MTEQPKKPLLVIVDGAPKTGKTCLIDRTCRALAARDVTVLHHRWLAPKGHIGVKDNIEFMLNQAYKFDAGLENMAALYDVVICDTHPIINLIATNIYYKDGHKKDWSLFLKPDLVLALTAETREIYKRIKESEEGGYKSISVIDRINLFFSELTRHQAGTDNLHFRDTTRYESLLFSSGFLRDRILTMLVQNMMTNEVKNPFEANDGGNRAQT